MASTSSRQNAIVSPRQFREDALAILDALGIEQTHLVAQSMGGWTCMRLLLDCPDRVRSLTMSCTPGGLPNDEATESVRNLTSSDGPGAVRLGRAEKPWCFSSADGTRSAYCLCELE